MMDKTGMLGMRLAVICVLLGMAWPLTVMPAADGQKRQRYIINSLAQSEVNVARYYHKRGAYVAAINRAQAALKDYPDTPAQEEALYLLTLSYDALGLKELAQDSRRVYAASYPRGTMLQTGPTRAQRPWYRPW